MCSMPAIPGAKERPLGRHAAAWFVVQHALAPAKEIRTHHPRAGLRVPPPILVEAVTQRFVEHRLHRLREEIASRVATAPLSSPSTTTTAHLLTVN